MIIRRVFLVFLPVLLVLGILSMGERITEARGSNSTVQPAALPFSTIKASEVYTLHLPVLITPKFNLYGYIYHADQPVADIVLRLYLCTIIGGRYPIPACDVRWATTNPVGHYGFEGNMEPTDATHWYFIEYLEEEQTPPIPDNRMAYWHQGFTYTGTPLDLGILDMSAMALMTPTAGAVLTQNASATSTTLQFAWTPRTVLSDTYNVFIIEGNFPGAPYSTIYSGDWLGHTNVFTHEFAYGAACLPDVYDAGPCAQSVLRPGEVYQWQIGVQNNQGAGYSHGFTFTLPATP